jgi:cytochrome b561
LRELFFGLHKAIGYALIVLIALHVAGALKHQWIDRDNLLARILP